MTNIRRKEAGFSFYEMLAALLIIIVLSLVIILAVTGFFSGAREVGLEADLRSVKTGVDSYMTRFFEAPTASGSLPSGSGYALIDFGANVTQRGNTYTFYPTFISKLPKHHDEGVWRINGAAQVSIDMEPEDY